MADAPQIPSEENERAAAAILQQIADLGATVFFEKPLTASDASGSGRVVIPKAIAEQYFPRLEQPSGLPVRAVDTRGYEYTFKFRFWINNQSRMYLLEGAGELHRQFTMSVGDVMVFAQKQDRTLVVAGRPATKNDVIRKAPVKRPAGAGGDRGKGGREPRSRAPKQPGAPGSDAARRKRAKPGGYASTLDAEPAVDGIFRAVPNTGGTGTPSGVAPGKAGRWVVTLNLAGELYQAYFDTQEDAGEAFHAAGGVAGKEEAPVGGVVMGGTLLGGHGHGVLGHHDDGDDDKGDDDMMDGDGDDD
uniref:TF-B3 domain-containing protein n=1 Tax=Chlamydomonas leiostraca TaxID=1034604 RepID=A0A7S0S0T7_9CHLO|mmetsp:Transcript_37379/g.94303  ORF Transcript_37379/g.94303 Transcript_37379/m.94303 type:complete len:303 (+) Transcript_37379:244-1152(+)